MKYAFARAAGLGSARAFLERALSDGRFPHALLAYGPEGVGQHALLLDLADILLCESAEERPCGRCRSCLAGRRNNQDNLLFLMPLEKKAAAPDGGELESAQVDELTDKARELRDDPYGFVRPEKGRIHINQVRELQARLAYAEAARRARVVLVLWAETMPPEAANALLKILEEPPADTYFLLASENRGGLLPTILSRCTQLALPAMEPAELRQAMAERPQWWEGAPPEALLPFAEGSLGTLLRLHRQGGPELLAAGTRFLASSLGLEWKAFDGFLEESAYFEDMDSGARLLQFVLRMIRLYHRLTVLEGAPAERTALAEALRRQGWDPALAGPLEPLRGARDLSAYAAFVESTLAAILDYAKPQMAALGHYLEFESKAARAAGREEGEAR